MAPPRTARMLKASARLRRRRLVTMSSTGPAASASESRQGAAPAGWRGGGWGRAVAGREAGRERAKWSLGEDGAGAGRGRPRHPHRRARAVVNDDGTAVEETAPEHAPGRRRQWHPRTQLLGGQLWAHPQDQDRIVLAG